MGNKTPKTEQPCTSHSVISRFFTDMAKKHNVKVDDLNLHINCNTLYIQEYTPNGLTEYNCLEMVDLNGL